MEPLKTQEAVQDFLSEVSTLIRLRHPNIIPVRGLGIDKNTGVSFIVMEYAPDGTLRQRHPRGTQVPLETVVSYVRQIADALQCAHDDNLIHRDVKPDNVLIGINNELLLSDFGIATFSPTLNMNLSQPVPQNTAGTATYIAPEQCQGHPEKASDQYSLAIMTYEWLCGTCPFKGSNHFEVYYQHINVAPRPLHELVPDIPPQIEAVAMKALAKAPKDRYASISDFSADLEDAFQQHLKSPKTAMQWFSKGVREALGLSNKLAIPSFTRAIELDPNVWLAYYFRGKAYKDLEQYDHAIADYNHALKLNPNLSSVYAERGFVYKQMKQYRQALQDYVQALEINPNYTKASAGKERVKEILKL